MLKDAELDAMPLSKSRGQVIKGGAEAKLVQKATRGK